MALSERFSEPYMATGGLAAEGVINQLGRPDIEPLEVLVREAVQNSWDAKRPDSAGVTVEIGRRELNGAQAAFCRQELLVDPPPSLPLAGELAGPIEIMYFADFGTEGLGGPTRADEIASARDFVDFVRNIGEPPDKDLGGGSFGYGKAAFYIASRPRTVLVDTLCSGPGGGLERRFIGCGLGYNFNVDGRPYTGRHWWGQIIDGVPEPLTGDVATEVANALGLPDRPTRSELGTTVVVVGPEVAAVTSTGEDETMPFGAEAAAWNFWPRMIDTPGAGRRTLSFRVLDGDTQVRIPNPRTHERLRGFVEAMDRLREEPGEDDELLLDRSVSALRPSRRLGRLVIQKGPVSRCDLPDRPVPVGARITADSVHHVALMRNAELVVRYFAGAVPVTARLGYSGVFKCAVDVDDAFRAAEPPTHDDWVPRAVQRGHDRRFVSIALNRITAVCREAAGYDAAMRSSVAGADIPLGEFADSMASLMPSIGGPGARSQIGSPASTPRRRRKPGAGRETAPSDGTWVDGAFVDSDRSADIHDPGSPEASEREGSSIRARAGPSPQLRSVAEPEPRIAPDGSAVVRYPFELRSRGRRLRLSAHVEIMSSDGGQVESEAPLGADSPVIRAWIDPSGEEHPVPEVEAHEGDIDGRWALEVSLVDEAMMRVDIRAEPV
jgi:hypothetical protein